MTKTDYTRAIRGEQWRFTSSDGRSWVKIFATGMWKATDGNEETISEGGLASYCVHQFNK
jgi:phage I-like protein